MERTTVVLVAKAVLLGAALALASCASGAPAVERPVQGPLTGADTETLARMREFLDAGLDRFDQGLYADGMKQLASVLAEKEKLTGPSKEAEEIAALADTELAKLGAALALEPDTAWLDRQNNQITGETLNAAIMPSVILTIKQASGRTLVSNAPIEFAFVQGGGVISGQVSTSDFGQANCTIAGFDNPQAEQVIRAALVIKVRGFTYRFKGVERDFVYSPPLQRATIFVLERSPLGVASDPFIVDPVFQELKGISFDFSLYNGVLSPDGFSRVYEGDLASIDATGLDPQVSYLLVLLSDCYGIRQLELGGVKYNLFVADARATLRVVRRVDGKILYQKSVERAHANGKHGQGGTQDKAAQDVFRKIAEDMAAVVKADLVSVEKALRGE